MGKKVRVTTKCGEEFFYDHDQEVETVEIVERKEYDLQERFNKALKVLRSYCPHGVCNACAFDGEGGGCAKVKARKILVKARGFNAKS